MRVPEPSAASTAIDLPPGGARTRLEFLWFFFSLMPFVDELALRSASSLALLLAFERDRAEAALRSDAVDVADTALFWLLPGLGAAAAHRGAPRATGRFGLLPFKWPAKGTLCCGGATFSPTAASSSASCLAAFASSPSSRSPANAEAAFATFESLSCLAFAMSRCCLRSAKNFAFSAARISAADCGGAGWWEGAEAGEGAGAGEGAASAIRVMPVFNPAAPGTALRGPTTRRTGTGDAVRPIPAFQGAALLPECTDAGVREGGC